MAVSRDEECADPGPRSCLPCQPDVPSQAPQIAPSGRVQNTASWANLVEAMLVRLIGLMGPSQHENFVRKQK